MLVVAFAAASCGPPDPCPNNGVIEGHLIIEDGKIRRETTGGITSITELGNSADDILAKCREVTGFVWVRGVTTSLRALDPIDRVGIDVHLSHACGSDGCVSELLPNLTEVGGGVIVDGSPDTVAGFGSLEELNGLSLSGDVRLVTGFRNLKVIHGPLKAISNARLEGLPGLANLESVGELWMQGSPTAEVADFRSLRLVNGDFLFKGFGLLRKAEFPALETVIGNFEIRQIPYVEDIPAPNLSSVGGDFVLEGTSLTSLGSFPSVRTIANDVFIVANQRITDAAAHAWVSAVNVGGTVTICENADGPQQCP